MIIVLPASEINLSSVCLSQNNLPEIVTPLGKIRGFWKTSEDEDGQNYAAFEGIPYAKPPVADLRFEEPQPILSWLGTWIADTTYLCMQVGLFPTQDLQGQEDCLYLNVYVPAKFLNNPKKLDVIVMIHGGGFMTGAGHILADSGVFMHKNVVYVSINYRLGLLGYLSTEDDIIPGNNGMKDQVLALKWVKHNIAFFGGNPDSVTLVGLSAGGASVHLHYLSPLSRGLFHKGVAQSGTALAPWVIRRNSLQRAKKLAVLVGCPDDSAEELKRCLKQRPAVSLLNQVKHFYGFGISPFSPFAPVVEGPSGKAFLDEEPYWLLKEGKVLDLPFVTSTSANEGLFPMAVYWRKLEEINEKWTQISCDLLDCNETLPQSRRETVPKTILNHYLGSGEEINKKNYDKFVQILTDRLFAYPAEVAAKMQANVTKSPVYYYFFNYREGENKMAQVFSQSEEVHGVAHAEDSIYCYGAFQLKPFSKKDKSMQNACQHMFYSYVSTGIPSFDGTDTWQPTGSTELIFLNISGPTDMKLQQSDSISSGDFWRGLEFLENEHIAAKNGL